MAEKVQTKDLMGKKFYGEKEDSATIKATISPNS